ncbi:hypothetical protein AVEN_34689-1 [Araneus ventricosus]|uniref:Uncharacterized protein n=1 Tax=Araneus ventricosus TaxID=182803 RepID=A0A4Y2AZL7_ARAVE|nr:hypothetical protein AVEN_34689-1 [Araneus ventricosus]
MSTHGSGVRRLLPWDRASLPAHVLRMPDEGGRVLEWEKVSPYRKRSPGMRTRYVLRFVTPCFCGNASDSKQDELSLASFCCKMIAVSLSPGVLDTSAQFEDHSYLQRGEAMGMESHQLRINKSTTRAGLRPLGALRQCKSRGPPFLLIFQNQIFL